MPDINVLEQQIKDLKVEIKELNDKLEAVLIRLGSKVSWLVFWSIVCLLVLIVGGMWGILYNEVKSVQNVASETSTDVSYIKGLLNNAERE